MDNAMLADIHTRLKMADSNTEEGTKPAEEATKTTTEEEDTEENAKVFFSSLLIIVKTTYLLTVICVIHLLLQGAYQGSNGTSFSYGQLTYCFKGNIKEVTA